MIHLNYVYAFTRLVRPRISCSTGSIYYFLILHEFQATKTQIRQDYVYLQSNPYINAIQQFHLINKQRPQRRQHQQCSQ
jgi:hypothetical protein